MTFFMTTPGRGFFDLQKLEQDAGHAHKPLFIEAAEAQGQKDPRL